MGYSQVVRRSFLVRIFKGSNPFIPRDYHKIKLHHTNNLKNKIFKQLNLKIKAYFCFLTTRQTTK
jgi:hypothetical protein